MKITFTILSILFFSTGFTQTWNIQDYLPSQRVQFKTVNWGDTMFIVGGNGPAGMTSSVDAYIPNGDYFDISYSLSSARGFAEPIAGDSAIYVVGGATGFPNWPNSVDGSSTVDIYKSGTWTTYNLADAMVRCSVVKVGSKIMITGLLKDVQNGTPIHSDIVYIYDEFTDVWSTATLSESRALIGAAANDTLAIFAGGWNGFNSVSDVVDIYNANTDTWTTATLSQARCAAAGAFGDGKFMFAGGGLPGTDASDIVDIFDGTTWSSVYLSEARTGIRAEVTPNRIVFVGGGTMDMNTWIYQTASNAVDDYNFTDQSWSISYMNDPKINHAVGHYGEVVYAIGGINFNDPYSLTIEKIDFAASIDEEKYSALEIFPNPAGDMIYLSLSIDKQIESIKILDSKGMVLNSKVQLNGNGINISSLANGNYFISVETENDLYIKKFVVLK